MIRYFVINNQSPAANYGIGTYIEQTVSCVRKALKACKITYIELLSNVDVLESKVDENGDMHIKIPFCNLTQEDEWYNKCTYYIMSLWIHANCDRNDKLVFHFNYAQHYPLAYALKAEYVDSSILFTVHYQSWCFMLKGNKRKLHSILSCDNEKPSRNKIDEVLRRGVLASIEEERKMMIVADYVIVLSRFTKNILNEYFNIKENKIRVIPNHLSPLTNNGKQKNGNIKCFDEDKKYLLYVGRLDDNKGIRLLFKAFKRIMDLRLDAHLIVVGEGDYSFISELEYIWDCVTFTGKVSKKMLLEIYAKAFLGIHPSFNEQCSYSMIEMMRQGIPIIGTDCNGVGEMLECTPECQVHIDEEMFDEEACIKSLCDKINLMLDNDELRDSVAEKQKRMYEDKFSNDSCMIEFIMNKIQQDENETNRFINDDFLKELDMHSVRLINSQPDSMDLDFYGLAGLALYLSWRLSSDTIDRSHKALLGEYMIYLIDWINDIAFGECLFENPYISTLIYNLESLGFYESGIKELASMLQQSPVIEISVKDIVKNQIRLYNYKF